MEACTQPLHSFAKMERLNPNLLKDFLVAWLVLTCDAFVAVPILHSSPSWVQLRADLVFREKTSSSEFAVVIEFKLKGQQVIPLNLTVL